MLSGSAESSVRLAACRKHARSSSSIESAVASADGAASSASPMISTCSIPTGGAWRDDRGDLFDSLTVPLQRPVAATPKGATRLERTQGVVLQERAAFAFVQQADAGASLETIELLQLEREQEHLPPITLPRSRLADALREAST